MKKRMLYRRYGLTLSAVVVAVLLLATLLLAGSVVSAGGHQDAGHAAALTEGRMTIRPSVSAATRSVFSLTTLPPFDILGST